MTEIQPRTQYNIIHRASGKYLDSGNKAVTVNAHNVGNRYQSWSFTPVGDGEYLLIQEGTGEALDAGATGENPYTNPPSRDNPFQVWKVKPSEDPKYNLIVHKDGGRYLDSDGNTVTIHGHNDDNKYQDWLISPVLQNP